MYLTNTEIYTHTHKNQWLYSASLLANAHMMSYIVRQCHFLVPVRCFPRPSIWWAAQLFLLSCSNPHCRDCDSCQSPRFLLYSLFRPDSSLWQDPDEPCLTTPGTSFQMIFGRPCTLSSHNWKRRQNLNEQYQIRQMFHHIPSSEIPS